MTVTCARSVQASVEGGSLSVSVYSHRAFADIAEVNNIGVFRKLFHIKSIYLLLTAVMTYQSYRIADFGIRYVGDIEKCLIMQTEIIGARFPCIKNVSLLFCPNLPDSRPRIQNRAIPTTVSRWQ